MTENGNRIEILYEIKILPNQLKYLSKYVIIVSKIHDCIFDTIFVGDYI